MQNVILDEIVEKYASAPVAVETDTISQQLEEVQNRIADAKIRRHELEVHTQSANHEFLKSAHYNSEKILAESLMLDNGRILGTRIEEIKKILKN